MTQRLVEGLARQVHVAWGWVARALWGHVESRAHRVRRESGGLSTKRLGTPSTSTTVAWGYLACHAALYTEASKGDRTAEEWRGRAPHLRGSEVILKRVGCNQVIHHRSRGWRKLRQV